MLYLFGILDIYFRKCQMSLGPSRPVFNSDGSKIPKCKMTLTETKRSMFRV